MTKLAIDRIPEELKKSAGFDSRMADPTVSQAVIRVI